MALSPDERKLVGKLLIITTDNQRAIHVIAAAMANYTAYLYPTMKKCDAIGCSRAATVENELLGMRTCDRCAATAIVNAIKHMTGDENDVLEPVRQAAGREELWRDIEGAQAIRTIEEHHGLINESERLQ